MSEYDAKIQCPDCGGMLKNLGFPFDIWSCDECDTSFDEEQIRERCGL